MGSIRFGIIGGGWRAEFFLRIAQALPERFEVDGVLVRDPAKAEAFSTRWRVPTFGTLDELLAASRGTFVVTSVPSRANAVLLRELAQRGVPVLSETPPAPDEPEMVALYEAVPRDARIQVAEQYHLQPMHAARIALANSGLLGRVTQAQVSAAHGYHGISLIRRLLGVAFEDARITAMSVKPPIIAGPGRNGPPTEEKIVDAAQDLAWLEFGDRLGVFDFTGQQYFSWIRSQRVLARGDRGEINNDDLRYLKDFRTFVHVQLQRENAGEDGNLEGYYLKGILAGDEWVYANPFVPGRLTDDEIAIATCLDKMAAYADGGPSFYSLPEACQDHYLSLMLHKAIETGETVVTEAQTWTQ